MSIRFFSQKLLKFEINFENFSSNLKIFFLNMIDHYSFRSIIMILRVNITKKIFFKSKL